MKNKTVIAFLIIVLILPLMLFASGEDEFVMFLPDLDSQTSERGHGTTIDDYSYLNGYDRVTRTIKASGYGKSLSSALADSHDRLINEVEGQLTYRMNNFTSSTLTDLVDYVRYYAVNRDKIISQIINKAETKKIEQMKYGFIVTREVSRGDFEEVFKNFISSATEQMGVLKETSQVATEQLNRLTGVFEEKDPIVFRFIDGEVQK